MARVQAALASGDADAVAAAIRAWDDGGCSGRLWAGDATLFTGDDEDRWLGWLVMPAGGGALDTDLVARLRQHLEHESIEHLAVLGMGGSSLCPDVLAHTFGADTQTRGFPQLHVFDSTVPAAIESGLARLDPGRTLFLVASKSGGTIEPNALFAHMWAEVAERIGEDRAGSRFVAITDAGSSLEALAQERGFAGIAYGVPEIGGRFSALSPFGLLPAALMGIDTADFLARARAMAEACGPNVAAADNPGVHLGLVMGTLASRGRDKLTLVISPGIERLGVWLEQLVAESTGKQGRGIVAIGDEGLGEPESYAADRLFAYVRLAHAPAVGQDAAVDALEAAGHPIVRMEVADAMDLGAEFFRWEIATSVACAVLDVNPFVQPDVESAKVVARNLMQAFEKKGALPRLTPALEEDGIRLFSDAGKRLFTNIFSDKPLDGSLRDALDAHLSRLRPGDYFSLNVYLDPSAHNEADCQAIRQGVRERYRVATTLGFGPRFLHSTGQLHKGGPNTGVYLQITSDAPQDLAVPGEPWSFDVLARAQAQGDFAVLVERGRRALWLHLSDPRAGLTRLREWLG
jgi:transaldolase/glucose-6-phosphate isomerase